MVNSKTCFVLSCDIFPVATVPLRIIASLLLCKGTVKHSFVPKIVENSGKKIY